LLFGDLQCSSQVGNITKFKRFDLICPTEREARISLSNKDDSIEKISNNILELTDSKNLIMKLGANGFITYSNHENNFIDREHFPSLTRNPIDVTGAGDSLLAGTSLSLACGADIMTASVIGASMASIAIQSVGNFSISKNRLLNYLKEVKLHGKI
jgi:sugar/nucleoside kinase (ribokinase family)